MKKDNEILKSLLVGGLIGTALWALLSENEDSEISKTARAATLSTFKANKKAQKTNVPVYVEEKGILYEISPKGEKRFVKIIEKPEKEVPEYFDLI